MTDDKSQLLTIML